MPIDLDILNELKEMLEDDFDDLVSIFISDGQMQIENLKLAIEASNTEDIRRISHTLKGSSANLGLNTLSESCFVLEQKAAENSLEEIDKLLENIVKNFDAAVQALEENFK